MASLYGKHWIDMWADVPIDAVKDEWAAGVSKFNLSEIGKAIDYCGANNKFPPTLPEFKAICKDMKPHEMHKAITRHLSDEELAENQRRIQEASAKLAKNPGRDPKQWARNILKDVANGIKLPDISVRFAKEALAVE